MTYLLGALLAIALASTHHLVYSMEPLCSMILFEALSVCMPRFSLGQPRHEIAIHAREVSPPCSQLDSSITPLVPSNNADPPLSLGISSVGNEYLTRPWSFCTRRPRTAKEES